MIRYEHHSAVPASAWRWRYFTPAELACKGTGRLVVMPPALDMLEVARGIVNRPLVINSAYRSPLYNAAVGGAPLSRHKVGDAFDIALAGHDRHLVARVCREVGFNGFGFYQSFIHVDARPRPAAWYGKGAQALWTG